MELPTRDVSDREVADVHLPRPPGRELLDFRQAGGEGEAEERQLETEAFTARAVEVARDVPPLVAVFGMRPVVLRKDELPRLESQRVAFAGVGGEEFREPGGGRCGCGAIGGFLPLRPATGGQEKYR